MSTEKTLIEIAKQIRAISQNGLLYSSSNAYDKERYEELLKLSNKITSLVSGNEIDIIQNSFRVENDYVTPKVDIRAVVFNNQREILLVKEKADGKWSLPGGWADVGLTPKENVVREVQEETGLSVKAVKLLAVTDKKCHDHPPATHYVYKLFILCELLGGTFNVAFDILDKGFFSRENLPPLSEGRVLKNQLDMMFEYLDDPQKEVYFD